MTVVATLQVLLFEMATFKASTLRRHNSVIPTAIVRKPSCQRVCTSVASAFWSCRQWIGRTN